MSYQELLDKEIERKILKSEEDYNNGRIKEAEDVFEEWQEKYFKNQKLNKKIF